MARVAVDSSPCIYTIEAPWSCPCRPSAAVAVFPERLSDIPIPPSPPESFAQGIDHAVQLFGSEPSRRECVIPIELVLSEKPRGKGQIRFILHV